jgi:KUP system potassium uptake protein
VLLNFYLKFRLKWKQIYVTLIIGLFAVIETSFFMANVAKIKQRWMFLFFELFIFLTMYVWYYGRKVNNRFAKFADIGKYTPDMIELSEDESIPKFCTHLIYLTKANSRTQVEEKIIKSIFAKKPKRADVYWFVHINRTEEPFTMTYDVSELIDNKVIKVNINIGFRIEAKTECYFRQIVKELVTKQELNLHIHPDGSTKYNPEPDFKFVVIEKFLSVENDFSLRNGMLLHAYFSLKNLGLSDEKAFGLDKNDVITEEIPFIFNTVEKNKLRRINTPYLMQEQL